MRSNIISWLLHRGWKWAIAWIIGCIIYFIGVMVSPYAGFEALICQPPMAVCMSGLFVFVTTLMGLPLALPSVRQFWSKAVLLNLTFLLAGIVLLFFSQALGLTAILVEPETSQTFVGPHPIAIVAGYFAHLLDCELAVEGTSCVTRHTRFFRITRLSCLFLGRVTS